MYNIQENAKHATKPKVGGDPNVVQVVDVIVEVVPEGTQRAQVASKGTH